MSLVEREGETTGMDVLQMIIESILAAASVPPSIRLPCI